MDVKQQLEQLYNFDDLTISQLTSWCKAIDSDLIVQAVEFGYKEDLAIIALMKKDCTSFENLLNVIYEMYMYRICHTDYFNTIEKLRVELVNLRDKISEKAITCQLTCVLCKESKVDTTFLMCGHLVTCLKCSKTITHCPLCKSAILEKVQIYYE